MAVVLGYCCCGGMGGNDRRLGHPTLRTALRISTIFINLRRFHHHLFLKSK
jgi:hypothetical protein